jgi:unsaturated chondroitin disaccharide hydrolase
MQFYKVTQLFTLFTFLLFGLNTFAQKVSNKQMLKMIDDRLAKATLKAVDMAQFLSNNKLILPKTFEKGKLVTAPSKWWTSGFYPGQLWYLYENKPSSELKTVAEDFLSRVEIEQYTTDNHDVGFMIFCSFGNAYRITKDERYKLVILQAASSLSTRFDDKVGLIKSWNSTKTRQYPVIIDNMMNLELLMWASKNSANKKFEEISLSHANKTIKNHFREDFSTYHLVSYDTISGNPHLKQTVQGYADNSAWARGQGWALYGYTMMYRETGDENYLKQAEGVAKFLINHPNLPKDGIPYWDFNAPNMPNALRDASAGALMASALIELSQLTKDNKCSKTYLQMAKKQIVSLSSPAYFAEQGTNGNFILKHSVGSLPGKLEVDNPLTYADYYYVEALTRFKKLLKKV